MATVHLMTSPCIFAWLPGPVPGAGHPPALLLPECLCLDAGGGTTSLQHGDKGLRVRGQQASLLLWDRLGYVVGMGQMEPEEITREGGGGAGRGGTDVMEWILAMRQR